MGAMPNLHDFTLPTIDGDDRALADYRGKVVLVVNVASRCGLTPQYDGLEKLHERYQARGFAVLGFPCNQFAGQEPGTEAEIKQFCSTKYGVTFPMFSKVEVNGPGSTPLYAWLTGQPSEPEAKGPIKWNFGKFLLGRDGALLARFDPRTDPLAPELVERVERALAAR
jgi:glutathione peroxidase